MKILIVDDEEMQRDMLHGFLVKQGYGVQSAASGDDALLLFAKHSFDLVLLDHRMDGMSGDELWLI